MFRYLQGLLRIFWIQLIAIAIICSLFRLASGSWESAAPFFLIGVISMVLQPLLHFVFVPSDRKTIILLFRRPWDW